jgi:hypothetical protein
MRLSKTKPSAEDAETIRINPKVSARQGIPNKTYQTFVSEMFFALIEGAKWIPLNFAADPEAAHREIARRRKHETEVRANDDARNAGAFHSLPNSMKARMIKAGSPGMSDKEAAAKASLVVGTKKRRGISEEDEKRESTKSMIARLVAKRSRKLGQPVPKDVVRDMEPNIHAADPKPTNEATSTNDPNRGRSSRKKPLVPYGIMPDGTKDPRTGNPVRTLGKLHSRMGKLSPETRTKYRQNYGYRTRVAGRGKRLYPSP